MDQILNILYMIVIAVAIVAVIITAMLTCYKRVKSVDEIIIIKGFKGDIRIAEQGAFVIPYINTYYILNLVPKKITAYSGNLNEIKSKSEISEITGEHNAFIHIGDRSYSKETISVDLGVEFKIKLNVSDTTKIIEAVKMYGEMLSDANMLGQYLKGQLAEAVKSATRKLAFDDLLNDRTSFREEVKKSLSAELDGLIVSDVSIVYVEHTPIARLQEDNMLDNTSRQAIQKINAEKQIELESINQKQETEVRSRIVEGEKARIQLNKSLEQEQAIADREIANTKEEEMTKKCQKKVSEELARQNLEINKEKALQIAEQDKEREIQNSKINNDQILGIKQEDTRAAIACKALDADMAADMRKVENQTTIAKTEKELIAQQAENTAMKDTLVKKEEEIKDTIAFKSAEREKEVKLTETKAASEAAKIERVAAASAEKEAFVLISEKMKIESETNFEVVERNVNAGKLEVALQIEKTAAPLKAEAEARKENAKAIREEGEAEAEVIQKKGLAEAETIASKGEAEASSLLKKYEATNKAGQETREHEIRKMRIEQETELKSMSIKAGETVGIEDAKARAAAVSKADIKVFGDQTMLRDIMSASAKVETTNEILENDKAKEWMLPYLSGEKSIPDEVKEMLKSLGGSEGQEASMGSDFAKLMLLQKLMESEPVKQVLMNK